MWQSFDNIVLVFLGKSFISFVMCVQSAKSDKKKENDLIKGLPMG